MTPRRALCAIAVVLLSLVLPARAEIVVGVVLSLSGPAAPVGRAQHAVVAHLPKRVGDEPVRYVLRDDASDPDTAHAAAVGLVESDSVDLVLGATTVAASARIIDAMAAVGVPVISPAAIDLGRIAPEAPSYWAFRTAPDTWLMANGVVAHLLSHGRKRLAFVAIEGPYGDQWWTAFGTLAETRGLNVQSFARFGANPDTWSWPHAIGQSRPDAVLVVAAGSLAVDAVHALRRAGYAGPIYQTHAVAVEAFRHACGDGCARVVMPASPARLNGAEGPGARFADLLGPAATPYGAYLWDAGLLFAEAARRAGETAVPGNAAFRRALRDALESVRGLIGANGVFSMGRRDHVGLDQRAVVMVSPGEKGWIQAD